MPSQTIPPIPVAAVQAEFQKGEKLALPTLAATEFLHVVTDARRFAPPLTMNEAIEWLQQFFGTSTRGFRGTDQKQPATDNGLNEAV